MNKSSSTEYSLDIHCIRQQNTTPLTKFEQFFFSVYKGKSNFLANATKNKQVKLQPGTGGCTNNEPGQCLCCWNIYIYY